MACSLCFGGEDVAILAAGTSLYEFDAGTGAFREIDMVPRMDVIIGGGAPAGPTDRAVLCMAVSSNYIAIGNNGKMLLLISRAQGRVVAARSLPKRPSAVRFSSAGSAVFVSDKLGDVYSFALPSLAGSEEAFLGHYSPITALAVSDTSKVVASADSVGKLRITGSSRGYDILSICLGHTATISDVVLPDALGEHLAVSSSFDGTVRLWDWKTASELQCIQVTESAEDIRRNARRSETSTGGVLALCINPDGDKIAAVTAEKIVLFQCSAKEDKFSLSKVAALATERAGSVFLTACFTSSTQIAVASKAKGNSPYSIDIYRSSGNVWERVESLCTDMPTEADNHGNGSGTAVENGEHAPALADASAAAPAPNGLPPSETDTAAVAAAAAAAVVAAVGEVNSSRDRTAKRARVDS